MATQMPYSYHRTVGPVNAVPPGNPFHPVLTFERITPRSSAARRKGRQTGIIIKLPRFRYRVFLREQRISFRNPARGVKTRYGARRQPESTRFGGGRRDPAAPSATR